MRLDLFENETAPEDGGGPAPAEAPAPAADAPADAPAADAPPVEAPAFDWESQEAQERIQQAATQAASAEREQLMQALAAAGVLQYDNQGPQAPDPFSDNYAAELAAYNEAMLSDKLEPIQRFLEAQQAERVEGQIGELISTTTKELGLEGVPSHVVRSLADAFAAETAKQYGNTPQAAQAAVRKAAEYLVAERKTAGEQAVEAYKKSITPGDSTPYEPAVRGAGVHVTDDFKSEADVARSWRERASV